MPKAYASAARAPFPTRECPNCHKFYHARSLKCPACGTANETRGESGEQPESRVRKVRVKRQPSRRVRVNHGSPLEHAISFVEAAGGVDAAREALGTIEKIRMMPR